MRRPHESINYRGSGRRRFSNELERATASFCELYILRKTEGKGVKKDFISRMFGVMMPKGANKLSLSKMNFGGIGPRLIRFFINKKEI